MENKLFPKKMSIFAIIITILYVIGNIALLYKLSDQFEKVHKYHFPILEMNAINIRLGQSLSDMTKNLIFEFDEQEYEEYKRQRDSLSFNISTYVSALEDAGKTNLITKDFNRDEVNKLEERIISLSKNSNQQEALDLFKGQAYLMYKNNYLDSIHLVAEELIIERDDFLKNKSELFQMGVILSVVFFGFLSVVWTRVYWAYKRNIDAKLQAEDELEIERMKSSHNAKMASLGEMAAGLAHEINNPLAIINGYSSKLSKMVERDTLDSESLNVLANKIKNTSFRISSIIKGLKAFSRDSQNDPLENVTVVDIIDDTLSFCQEKLKNNGVRLEVIHPEKDVFVSVRPVEISQVILNLLNNSFDEISSMNTDDPWVKLETSYIDEYVKISVTDCGNGISDEVAKRLFEPFFTTKDVNKGTGLGLSISRNIIEKHGGKFYLDQEKTNTCFVILIPPSKDQEESAAA
jgi:C4-dicarboxylate-specific signal transduction histidine kinase